MPVGGAGTASPGNNSCGHQLERVACRLVVLLMAAGSSGETDLPGTSERLAAHPEPGARLGQGGDGSVVREPAAACGAKLLGWGEEPGRVKGQERLSFGSRADRRLSLSLKNSGVRESSA